MSNHPSPSRSGPTRMQPLAACLAAILTAAVPLTADAANGSGSLLAGMAEPLPNTSLAWMRPALASVPPRAPTVQPVTHCGDDGPGSLRVAVETAVDGDVIDLTQLNCSTISLTTGAIIFGADSLALHGPGRNNLRIDGSGNANDDGMFVHLGFGSLIFEDLELANGHKYRSDVNALGGCIHSEGHVILRDSAVTDCKARSQVQFGSLGGGIFTQGITSLEHSVISGNVTEAAGYGYASGGGVYALGGIISLYSLVQGNRAYSPSATPSFGGGIFARGASSIGESCVSHNSSARMGGVALADNGTSLSTVFQTTISQNLATQIGGMYSRRPTYLYNSTISKNVSVVSVNNAGDSIAAGLQMGAVLLTFHSTILSDNVALDATAFPIDLDGKPGVNTTGTNNLITGTPLAPPPDTIGFTPALGPLVDNGGFTPTHSLIRGLSYAIDDGGLPPAGTFPNDQRGVGFLRWIGASVDIGAFESDPDRIFTTGTDFGMAPLDPATVDLRVLGGALARTD